MSDDDDRWCRITDGTGTRWVKVEPRTRRKPGRALRFEGLQPGAVLIHRAKWKVTHGVPAAVRGTANNNGRDEQGVSVGFAIVEHRWFDPVAGEHDPVAGEMAAVRDLTPSGSGRHLRGHTLRGLASNGYHPATPEQAEAILIAIEERVILIRRFDDKEITRSEAQLAVTPWKGLLRRLGLA